MSELFLIAHKVTGEPAFDVATKMVCGICNNRNYDTEDDYCSECEGQGFWWIIPTSGRRAYPYWSEELRICVRDWIDIEQFPCPEALPDHYAHTASPSEVRDRLASLLASLPPTPKTITRGRR